MRLCVFFYPVDATLEVVCCGLEAVVWSEKAVSRPITIPALTPEYKLHPGRQRDVDVYISTLLTRRVLACLWKQLHEDLLRKAPTCCMTGLQELLTRVTEHNKWWH